MVSLIPDRVYDLRCLYMIISTNDEDKYIENGSRNDAHVDDEEQESKRCVDTLEKQVRDKFQKSSSYIKVK